MIPPKKRPGRPEMLSGKRNKIIKAKLTEEEFQQLLALEKEVGINRTELIRIRVLHQSNKVFLNAKTLLQQLDALGAEMGRSGNNINQLARHANALHHYGNLDETIVREFNLLLRNYLHLRSETEKTLRQIIRLIRG
ncbi:plasmid mobilization protein [Mucilaginibacter lacusdianchii]|uniref:plasmid mobilization protein n=1 Tax=Mucilaginibacter lacusdianchii TaxID=2684211 RepID=UPI00131BBD3B|nr:plasmid mobilization relaxosome protein MobC [Mucilaginibacter sp. JXJ CY 39]